MKLRQDELPIIGEELLEYYAIGDLVKFCGDDLLEIKQGIILDIYNLPLSERMFPHATVYVMGHDTREQILLGNLTILSKVSD
tara:strand:+ start:4999 stop:5247 length:249 start_codon:yes stop_codon:yes gene_type:complete